MPRKRHTPEQIIRKLREAEVELAKGQTAGEVVRKLGITEQTYYRWRKEYGGLRLDQAKRLKELEKENARLKKLLAEQSLDNAILKEAASGNFRARPVGAGRSRTSAGGSASRSAGPAGCWARPARHSATRPGFARTSLDWWPGILSCWCPRKRGKSRISNAFRVCFEIDHSMVSCAD